MYRAKYLSAEGHPRRTAAAVPLNNDIVPGRTDGARGHYLNDLRPGEYYVIVVLVIINIIL